MPHRWEFPLESTALLVIDPVNDFLSKGGADWDLARSTVKKHDVVGHLKQALAGARAAGVPVLFAPMAFTAEDYEVHQMQARSGINRMMFERKMFIAGSWGADFHPELTPFPGEVVLLPHKGIDVFETDLPDHLERLATTHLVIAGMTANLCCESTGRQAMERGYDVTFLRDAIGADSVAAHEIATRLNYPLIANSVLDVAEFLQALRGAPAAPTRGSTVRGSDRIKIGKVSRVAPGRGAGATGYLKVRRGLRRRVYVPIDAVTRVVGREVFLNVPRLFVNKMPWGRRPTAATRQEHVGPPLGDTTTLYRSRGPSSATPLEE